MSEIAVYFRSVALAFTTFSRLPAPLLPWDNRNMRYLLAALPLVGIVVGALLALWCWLCGLLHFGMLVWAAGITVIPLLVSGGIHLDGLCDVVDALASNSPPERRREILKDPHVGAFAIIGAGVYLIAYLGFCSEVPIALPGDWPAVVLLCCIPVVSRIAGGAASLIGTRSKEEGMLSSFQKSAEGGGKTASLGILAVMFAAVAALMIWAQPIPALVMLAGALVLFLCAFPFARRKFGGMSGDIAGAIIQMCDLAMLICLVVALKVMAICC